MDQNELRKIIEAVIAEMVATDESLGKTVEPTPAGAKPLAGGTASMPAAAVGKVALAESGSAERGTDPKEVVIGLSPAFSAILHETIIGLPHAAVLKEICAGIEEQGLKYRFIKVFRTADV
ncbi:MAG: propanediol dehydratase, partial [Propionibacterium sp.]